MKHSSTSLLVLVALGAASAASAQSREIRKIDFKNFAYAWSDAWEEESPPEQWRWITTPPKSKVTVVKGIHRFEEDAFYPGLSEPVPAVSVDSVDYGEVTGDGKEEAFVALNYGTGGTANWDYLYVFRMRAGVPSLMEIMETGSRGSGGFVGVSVQRQVLVLDFADKDRMTGDCCSDGFIRVRYRWRGGRFVEVGPRERGDMDRRTERPSTAAAIQHSL